MDREALLLRITSKKYPISTECNKALQKMLLYEVTNNIYRRRIAIAKGEGAVVISAFSTEHGKVGLILPFHERTPMDKSTSQEMLAQAEKLCVQRNVRLTPQRLEVLRLMSLQQGQSALMTCSIFCVRQSRRPNLPLSIARWISF
jgi:hypothetical protein